MTKDKDKDDKRERNRLKKERMYTGGACFSLSLPLKNSLFNFHLHYNTPQTTMTKEEDDKIKRKRLKREKQKANKRRGWAHQAPAHNQAQDETLAQAQAQALTRVVVPARQRKVSFESVDLTENCDIYITQINTTVCVFPPMVEGERQLDSVCIDASEMYRLGEGEHLNDSLLEFDLQYLQKQTM